MNLDKQKRVTLQTIADRLGISRTTVSNAYSRPDQLTPELRRKILETAKQLGYTGPDPAARTLRQGRSGVIGIVFSEILLYAFTDPAAVLFLQGVAAATERAGLSLLLLPASPDQRPDPASVHRAVADSFLVYSVTADDPRVDAILERGLPAVIVDQPERTDAAFIGVDDRAAARAIARHILSLGHRRIGVATFSLREDGYNGPVTRERLAAATYPVTIARLDGYADALREVGHAWEEVSIQECWPNSREAGRIGGGALLDTTERPSAILATSDQLALGVVQAARERGLAVPAALSVAGFDDIPAAAVTQPALTTVAQPLLRKGRLAGEMLLQGWPLGEPPRVMQESQLQVRASTGPAPVL